MIAPAHGIHGPAAPRAFGTWVVLSGATVGWLALWCLSHQQAILALLPAGLLLSVLSAATVTGAARGRKWAIASLLVFVIFGLSLSLRTREYGETGLDWQNGLKMATWMLIVGVGIVQAKHFAPLFCQKAVALAGLFGLVALLSAGWSLTPAYTAANSMGVIAYLVLACLAVSALGIDATLRVVTFTLLAYIALALTASVLFPQMAWLPPSASEASFRLRGLSGHPNVLGEQAALLVTFALVARSRQLVGRPILACALFLGFTTLLASGSRTTTMATLVAWFVVALRERGLLLPAVLAALGFASIGGLLASAGQIPNVEPLLGSLARSGSVNEIATLTGRTDLWTVAVDLIASRPWLGWGFNGTEALIVGSVGRAFVGDPVNMHNMYIQVVLSLGILGALPGLAMLGYMLVRMIYSPDRTRDQIVLLTMLIGLAEVSIFATPVLLTIAFFLAAAYDATLVIRQRAHALDCTRGGKP